MLRVKLSELIARLAEMLEEHGDVRVLHDSPTGPRDLQQIVFESSSEREAVMVR